MKILGLHADRLRLRFGLDRFIDAHVPLLVQLRLGHAVREGRAGGQALGQPQRFGRQRVGCHQAVEKAPAFAFIGAHRAPGVQEFGCAALADDARQQGAGPHVATGQTDAGEQERDFRRRRPQAQVGGHRDDRAGAGANAVDRRDHRLRAMAHRLHQIAGHVGEIHQLRHLHLRQRPDDLVHVAAGAEIAAGAGDDHHLDVGCILQRAEQVAQLRIGLEGQGVFAFRAVERDGPDWSAGVETEMPGPVVGEAAAMGE